MNEKAHFNCVLFAVLFYVTEFYFCISAFNGTKSV